MSTLNDQMAFNTLNDDDLFDLFRSSSTVNEVNYDSLTNFDESVVNHINSSAEELELDFNFDDPASYNFTKYITNHQFHDIVKDFENDTFSLLHVNIRSLNKHFDDLKLFLDNPTENPFSVIGLTETWVNQDLNQPYSLSDYDFVVKNRQNRIGGGVALYVHTKYNYIVRDEISLSNDFIESLFIEIIIPNSKNILIGVIYRPPNSNVKDFLTHSSDLLRCQIFNNNDSFIMGDFNINLLKRDHDHNNVSQDFLEILLSASFLPLISKPTRVVSPSSTLIDNIFSNVIPHPESYIVLSDMTDHYPIMTYYTLSQSVKSGPRPLRRKVNCENIARLGASLENIDWSCVYDIDEVNCSYDMFCEILNGQLDICMPIQRDKGTNYKKNPRLPWISKSVLRSINRKNNLYYKYKSVGTEQSKIKYTSYKNTLTKIIRLEKRKYFVDRLELYKHDMQNTWKIIKQAMNIVKNKCDITKINVDNEIVEDPNVIPNIFNKYFSSVGDNLARDIPPTDKHFVDFLGPANPNSIFFTPIHKFEILDIVSNLNDKKSSGCDGINNCILKGIIPYIVDPLVHIFNLSLLNGEVPDTMKIAKVIPLFKKGDKLDITNYRPISLLPSISKILEKIICIRLVSFLKNENILSNFQFGFREKYSTTHALLSFIEKVAHAIDKSSHMVGIFLDFSKAFDTVNHDILLYKLSHYGVRGKALEWFRNYLSNRQQYVFVNNHSSELRNISCGVPQGSILGPLLFILYINDFSRSSDVLSFVLFADDTNLFFSHDNPHTLAETINVELVKVLKWIRANKLSLNLQKTKYMLFSKSIHSLPIDIAFEDFVLENVSNIKFLGVTVDNQLSWKFHINNICKVISRNIGIINRLKFHLPLASLLMLYSSLILPYLNYGILTWGNTHVTLLDKLLLLQKKALRIIFNMAPRSHTDSLFLDNNILKIKDLYLFQLGQFMYNYNNNTLPAIFDEMFLKNQLVHKYPTRHSGEFHLPLLRTLLAQNTFIYTGPKFWNTLSDYIKNATSFNLFKKRIKLLLLQSYKTPS